MKKVRKIRLPNHNVTINYFLQIFSLLFFAFYSLFFILIFSCISDDLDWHRGRRKNDNKVVLKTQKTWVEPSKNISYLDPKKVSLLFCGSFLFFKHKNMSTVEMSTLVTFAKTKGFVYQGSEIYGGLANSWDYGPLGATLKENIKNLWIKNFVQKRKDMVLLDAAIMMNPNVWVASGHVGSFSDPLMECRDCHTRHRADKLIEEGLEKDANFPVPTNWA